MKNIALLTIYVLVSTLGLYKLKSAREILDLGFLMGFVLYGLGFVLWLLILRLNPLSIAFPIAASSLMIGTQIVSYFLLKEPFSIYKFIGVLFIIFGIFLIQIKS